MNRKTFSFLFIILIGLPILGSLAVDSFAEDGAIHQLSSPVEIQNPFGVCHGQAGNEEDRVAMVNQGVQISRNDLTWSNVERVNNSFDFSGYQTFYDNLNSSNIDALAILDYGNRFLHGEQYDRHIPTEKINDWIDYVNNSIDHFRNLIQYWEIWNEPNLEKFWNGTDLEFYYLMNVTAHFIRQNYPEVKIVAPGISGHSPEYLSAMIEYVGADEFNLIFDVLNFHPYSGSNAEIVKTKIEEVYAVAEQFGFAGEIWITEVGYSTQVSSLENIEAERDQQWVEEGDQMVKIVAEALAHNISRLIWYCYRDWKNIDWLYGEAAFGIQHYSEQYQQWIYKPAGYAFQWLSQKLSGATYYPNLVDLTIPIGIDPSQVHTYNFLTSANTIISIIWSQTLVDQVHLSMNSALLNVSIFDFYTNRTSQVNNVTEFSSKIGLSPIILETSPATSFDAFGLDLDLALGLSIQTILWLSIILLFSFVGIGFILIKNYR